MKQYIYVLATLIFFLQACHHHHHDHDHDHGHEHDDINLLFTDYDDVFEIFAEADPFVVGRASHVLIHLTFLSDFKPLESGTVKVTFSSGQFNTVQTIESPSSKGIFRIDILPEATGEGLMVFEIFTEDIESTFSYPVRVFDNEHDAIHAAEDAEFSETNAVAFSKEQSWKINFATAYPETIPFGQVIRTTAKVQSAQSNEITLTAKNDGIVIFGELNMVEGMNVNAGAQLLIISGSELAERNSATRFLEARNNYENTKANYERQQALFEDRIVSERQMLDARTAYENAKAIYDNLSRNFSVQGQHLRSPASGYISRVFVKNGAYVETGQQIMTIAQNKDLWLRSDVQLKYAAHLKYISAANIRTLHDGRTYSLESLNGSVLSYGQSASADNFLIPVTLQIENNGEFFPGTFAEVFLKTTSEEDALTVPNHALIEEQGNFFVFVQLTPELFEKREIKIGVNDGFKTAILSGITANERVVTKGAAIVKLAESAGALDPHAGHTH